MPDTKNSKIVFFQLFFISDAKEKSRGAFFLRSHSFLPLCDQLFPITEVQNTKICVVTFIVSTLMTGLTFAQMTLFCCPQTVQIMEYIYFKVGEESSHHTNSLYLLCLHHNLMVVQGVKNKEERSSDCHRAQKVTFTSELSNKLMTIIGFKSVFL